MLEDIFPVLLLMLLCIPVTIILIHSLLHEAEMKELTLRVERAEEYLFALLGVTEPRQLMEADLPPDVAAVGGDND